MDTWQPVILKAEDGDALSSGGIRFYGVSGKKWEDEDVIVGVIDLYAYDPINHRAAVGIMVATEYRCCGYAKSMLRELETVVRDIYHLHQLYVDIAATNTRSLHLFEKMGYEHCGTMRQWLFVKTVYVDCIRMQKLL